MQTVNPLGRIPSEGDADNILACICCSVFIPEPHERVVVNSTSCGSCDYSCDPMIPGNANANYQQSRQARYA